ncbi:MAG TPA: tripartite tricarboxylate transporter substrate binding protein [Burkholderiaceae bacterium]|nr:tripartite tricarboxylate transporter substrate binding protein [Burkholderiaceae bacterium]
MTRPISRRDALASLAGALLAPAVLTSRVAHAQKFPARPITLVVPWPAGGSTDRHFRTLGEIAGKHLGQPIVIENKPGAGGTLGPSSVALTSQPDGYRVAQYPLGMLRYPHMQKVNWHPIDDFTFIIGISGYTFGFVVKSDSPFKSFNDYIEAARKQPGKIDYGSTGTGTSPHLLMEEVAEAAKVKLNHVPFKGNADLMQALLGGHVMAASDATGWDKFVDQGQMRLLVTFGEERTKRWRDVPTAKDLGYNVVSTSPYGLVGPKGMDPGVVKALHDGFRKAMDDPKHLEVLDQLNQTLWYRSGEDYRKWAVETFQKEKALIEKLGLAAK